MRAGWLDRLAVGLVVPLATMGLSWAPPAAATVEARLATDLPLLPSDPLGPAPVPSVPVGAADVPAPPTASEPDPVMPRLDGGDGSDSFDPARSERLPEFTTATQEVFQNADGSQTARVTTRPKRVQDPVSKEWREVDLAVRDRGNGDLAATAAPLEVVIPADPGKGMVEVAAPAGTISVGHPDVAPTPAVGSRFIDGNRVELDPRGPVRSVVRVQAEGFEQDVVFDRPEVAVPSYRLVFTLPRGLTARDAGAAGVEFVDADGAAVGWFGSGIAFDSGGRNEFERPETEVVTRLVGVVGSVATVEVAILDPSWLHAKERVYPVTIDPVFYSNTTLGSGGDTFVGENILYTSQWSSTPLKTGRVYGSWYVRRAFVRFDLTGLPAPGSRVVTNAQLHVYNSYTPTCPARQMQVYVLTGPFDQNTLWSNQPGYGGYTDLRTFAHGYNSSCPGAWEALSPSTFPRLRSRETCSSRTSHVDPHRR